MKRRAGKNRRRSEGVGSPHGTGIATPKRVAPPAAGVITEPSPVVEPSPIGSSPNETSNPEASRVYTHLKRAIESRVVTLAGLLSALYFCHQWVPLTAPSLLQSVHEFAYASYGNSKILIYPNVNRRPFEVCDSQQKQRDEMFARVTPGFEGAVRPISEEYKRITALVRVYNREATSFYYSDCKAGWARYFYYIDYAYSFPGATPYVWLIRQFGLTEIYVSLAVMLGAYIGCCCAFLEGRKILGSNLGGLLTLAGLAFAAKYFSYGGIGLQYDLLAFPLMYAGQLLAASSADGKRLRTPSWRWFAGLILFAVFSVITLFGLPVIIKLWATAVAVVVTAVLLMRRNRNAVMQAAVVVIVLLACRFPYSSFSEKLLRPVSALDSAQGAEFTPVTMIGYTFERPSYDGFLIGDANYAWILNSDPILKQTGAPSLFHSFRPWSNSHIFEVLIWRPWLLPLHWWRRFFEVVRFHEVLSTGMYLAHPVLGTRIFWFGLLMLALACVSGRDRPAVWPAAAICLFELFGVNVLQGLFHGHALYLYRGVWILGVLIPVLTALICVRIMQGWAAAPRVLLEKWRLVSRRRWLSASGTVAAILIAWVMVQEARRESVVFRIWTAIDFGLFAPEFYRPHDWLTTQLEDLKSLGSLEPGAVSMYAANVMFFQYHGKVYHQGYLKGKLNVDFDAEAERCRRSMIAYYRTALKEAPDNPHFPTYAQMMELPEWVDVFKRAIKRFPDSFYVPMMAFYLSTYSFTPQDRAFYSDLAADSLGRFYRQTANYRPGFRRLPSVTGPISASAQTTAEGMRVVLKPREEIWLDAVNTWGSDRFKLALFAKVYSGEATLCIATTKGCRSDSVLVKGDTAFPYRILETKELSLEESTARVVFRAGDAGATLALRDLYPLVENPRFY